LPPPTEEDELYPESDGEPMADSTLQWEWIDRIKGGLEAQFKNNPNVFVAGDFFWYPVEGLPGVRVAPDAMVVFGRPKGYRRSYLQWREEGIAPQVVFEIWSYSNRPGDKEKKLDFYDRYGVEEYYALDPRPSKRSAQGWIRQHGKLTELTGLNGWKSPRLGVSFLRVDGEWNLYHPDGESFANYEDLYAQRNVERAMKETERAAREAERAAKEAERAAKEAAWAKLRELGVDPESL
jgi:Uma2 family endonuclease